MTKTPHTLGFTRSVWNGKFGAHRKVGEVSLVFRRWGRGEKKGGITCGVYMEFLKWVASFLMRPTNDLMEVRSSGKLGRRAVQLIPTTGHSL